MLQVDRRNKKKTEKKYFNFKDQLNITDQLVNDKSAIIIITKTFH